MTDARKRIAELEEALRPFADLATTVDGCADYAVVHVQAHVVRRAAAVIEQAETPAQEPGGDVERVKITEALETADAWLFNWAKHVGTCAGGERCTCGLRRAQFEVREAIGAHSLAAMRPVSVDEGKLAEIRARHDSVADMADDEWDNRIYTIADDAFSDRAALLEMIGGNNAE